MKKTATNWGGGIVPIATLATLLLSAGCAEQKPGAQTSREAPSRVADIAVTEATAAPATREPVIQTPATRDAATLQNAFAEVAKVAAPSVVTLTTQVRRPRFVQERGGPQPFGGPPGREPFGGEDPFEEFFRRFRGFGFEPGRWERGPDAQSGFLPVQSGGGSGIGSGLIYSADGLILTNAHVVRDAESVTVKLADDREFKNAKVVGLDTRTDVAVVKIPAKGLSPLQLGDSSAVRVGDWAIAVGNPFGLEKTLTVGVISAKAREVPLSVASPGDYLQTDASINPGNSGGPLLNIYGRVIGVNNAIYSRSGGNMGIGFAIPINTAREIADILVKEGRVRRARLGIGISNIEDRAAAFGLDPKIEGVLIEMVEPNGPGARAGLQPGDVITAFNGKPVTNSSDFQRQVARSPIGTNATLTIRRGGKTMTVTARLEELKDGTGGASPGGAPPESDGGPPTTLGLRLTPLTPDLARRYGSKVSSGVIIVGVQDNSPAMAAGLRPGDILQRVGQTAVSTPQEVKAAVDNILSRQSGDNKSIALYVNRQGESRFVVVDVSK